jgi:mRNA-degrading endonuclease toxin of MazEF toxin-antitoxin module
MGEEFLRPAVIIRKFNNEVLWVIPLTKSQKTGPYYLQFSFEEGVVSSAILSQIRLIDAKRLMYLKGYMSKEEFEKLREKIRALLS